MILDRIVLSKSKTFLAFCFSFLVGVAAAPLMPAHVHLRVFIFFFFPLLFLFGFFWSRNNIRFFLATFLCFFAGILRLNTAIPSDPPPPGEFTGFVAAEPDIRIADARYVIESHGQRVYLKMPLHPQYQYGDVVRARCAIEAPSKDIDGFRYDMYLARLGVFWICQDPVVEKVGDGQGNAAMRKILSFKHALQQRVEELWPEPQASFMAGLLYGYRGGLGELQESFNRTGVSHVVAISGFNITIIAVIFMSALTFVHIRRQRAFWIVCAGIIGFTLLVGGSSSVVRAAALGLLALVAKQVGRQSRPIYLLAPIAAVMVLQNPFILLWDAGFHLSFAATFGLLSFAPLLEPYLKKIGSQTVAAIIFTLPLLLYHFGRFSLVAPIVNILVLWLIPWLMLVGAIAVAASFLWFPAGFFIAWIASFGLQYILLTVSWFSGLSFAAFDVSLPWWGMFSAYLFLFFLFRRLVDRRSGSVVE